MDLEVRSYKSGRGLVRIVPLPPVPVVVHRPPTRLGFCMGCGRVRTAAQLAESLWGECSECENERMEDIWSG